MISEFIESDMLNFILLYRRIDNEDEPVVSESTSTSEPSEASANQLDMVERRRSYRELGMMAVRLSNSQTGSPSGEAARQASVSQSTQTGNNVFQNMATQTDFGNEGHVAGRERIAERRSDVYEALRSGTFVEERAGENSEGSAQRAEDESREEETQRPSGSHHRRASHDTATGERDQSTLNVRGSVRGESCDASTEITNHDNQLTRGEVGSSGNGRNSRRTFTEDNHAELDNASRSSEGSATFSRLSSTNVTCHQPCETNSAYFPGSNNPETRIISPRTIPSRRLSADRDIPASSHSCRMLHLDSQDEMESSQQPNSTTPENGIRSSTIGTERSAFHAVGPGGDAGSSALSSSSSLTTISYGHRTLSRGPIRFIESMSQESDGSDPEEQRNMTGVSQSVNSRGRSNQSIRHNLTLDLTASHVVQPSSSEGRSLGDTEEGSPATSESPSSRLSHHVIEGQRSVRNVSSRSRTHTNPNSPVRNGRVNAQASNQNTQHFVRTESLQDQEQDQELASVPIPDLVRGTEGRLRDGTRGQVQVTMEVDDDILNETAQDT